jgi:hypothetical protein
MRTTGSLTELTDQELETLVSLFRLSDNMKDALRDCQRKGISMVLSASLNDVTDRGLRKAKKLIMEKHFKIQRGYKRD